MDEFVAQKYVLPFYDDMPLGVHHRADELVRVAVGAPLSDLIYLLKSDEWRSRQIGAWLAIGRGGTEMLAAVYASLLTSDGELTAPELAAAALVLGGRDSLPVLQQFSDQIPPAETILRSLIERAIDLGLMLPTKPTSASDASVGFDKYLQTAYAIASSRETVDDHR